MSKHPFHKFLDLINFDKNIHTMQMNIQSLTKELKLLNDQEQESNEQLDSSKKKIALIRSTVNQLELDMKKLDLQQKNKKSQLEDSSKYKEYQSLQKDYERLQELQHAKETELLQQWKILELAEQKLITEQKVYDEKIARFHKAVEEKKQIIVVTQLNIVEQEDLRESKEKLVPAEWLEKYNVMRTRISDPVVVLQNNHCSVCFQDMTNQELIRLRHGALLQCQGCYRLLYLEHAVVGDDEPAQEQ